MENKGSRLRVSTNILDQSLREQSLYQVIGEIEIVEVQCFIRFDIDIELIGGN